MEVLISPFDQLISKLRRLDVDAANYILTHENVKKYSKYGHLSSMFIWMGTPQGQEYWSKLCEKVNKMPDVTDKGNVIFDGL